MASSKDFKDFILDELSLLPGITCRYMMSEYILYNDGLIFGGIYDDRLLVKKTETNKKYNMEEAIPYPKGKPMYLVSEVENPELLRDIILDTCEGLKK